MYATPQEFSAALFTALRKPVPPLSSTDHLNQEWKRIAETRFRESRVAESYTREEAQDYRPLIDELWNDALRGAPSKLRRRLVAEVAIGVLDCGAVNAVIYRARESRVYAIFLNLGLIQLLNIYLQLREGYFRPSNVLYCTRDDAQKLTRTNYGSFIEEHVINYLRDGYPNGPKIHLRENVLPKIGRDLYLSELFILAHEIGHLENGDLDALSNFATFNGAFEALRFSDSKSHEQEFAADRTGFNLLLKIVNAKGWSMTADNLIGPVCVFFCLFPMLQLGESVTHPCPLERARRLATEFCSAETCRLVLEDIDKARQC